MTYKVNLVEDDSNLNSVLTSYLKNEGWLVTSFHTGEAARKSIADEPHLWILDIMLPDIDGYQLIREIKKATPQIPVIFISARDADIDRIIGLELGSEDYLPKPFLPRELVIRARKLLARVYNLQDRPTILKILEYKVNESRRMVESPNGTVDLTSKEFDILLFLVKNQGQALSREQVLNHVWGTDYFGSDRVVDDLVRRLRRKLPDLRIETLYGYGYRMVTT